MDIINLDALAIAESIREGEISAVDATTAFLERIREVEAIVNAYINVSYEEAARRAEMIDAMLAEGRDPGPLAGVPIAVKDLLSTRGFTTTCGSRMLENFVPVYDATVVGRVGEAGMVMLGKANMDEFAMGSSTETSYFGPTRNPWNPDTVPGGSSGGSAAAVSAGEAPWALGSDTGGSIRQPAAMCGIVGMKPTYGLVSRYGLVAFASSLDQVGPMARNVGDCAALLGVIAGHDPMDSTSIPAEKVDYQGRLDGEVRGLKVGVVKEISSRGIDEGVLERFRAAVSKLEGLGMEVGEISLPSFEYALSAYYVIAPAEASSNLARFDGVRYGFRASAEGEDIWEMYDRTRSIGFGSEVKRRIILGTYVLSAGYYDAYYGQARKVRTLIVKEFERAFRTYDVLVSPTTPSVAFRLGEKVDDPLTMYLSDMCTIPVNLAGIPAISLPCGLSEGMPVGFQLMGPALGEATVLNVAYALESELGFDQRPPIGRS
ncbi:MAG: Asp-tRNA(Asn)/Glu-tRNA(Gln) amidotransferase subunit GatA [Actinobacteria bacterium]|nr:Asp-tRNA(Asn)/Glu-tRNA(Gln) amidotransferase subunit GatA [Actinomycetota bacterium]MCG2817669.1 Asp-tRNA(Asn)/Glu-tRNA(Gln) amidotransferase subunit GatA [Actinomycetes bacterium]MBU4219318.1 Asp-tRNA(Asn)/Glu-tRNA(Gln) amidotransferase subunit GatA [Actinomycetota bacterium]MBU4359602.1 Asp-tRNA(Asn)/Glu-tRNA(Gln) amidotransferase subunit GatA [Actinomycetota bacterium]MBU4392165.1 Asp-tRNA(Asn)/Glu-tRNA(Gln) amidotransferase subunit GatA [Actinomycetota bacterium]